MKYRNLIVDVSNIYYRAYFSTKATSVDTDQGAMPTQGIYTSIKMIQHLERDFLASGGAFFFLFDNASSGETRRKNLDPEYKINRRKQEPGFYRGLDFLQLLLTHYADNWRVIQYPEYEADDLVVPVLHTIGSGEKCALVSNDMDWGRAITEDVSWIVYERYNGVRCYHEVNIDHFLDKFGFKPSIKNICIYKSICGDRSDNIHPGVDQIPKAVIISILDKVSSIQDLFEKLDTLQIPDHWRHQIHYNRGRIMLNYAMVDYQEITVEECDSATVISKYEPRVLEMLYKMLKFDIEKIDMRAVRDLRETDEPDPGGGFFQFSKYGRA